MALHFGRFSRVPADPAMHQLLLPVSAPWTCQNLCTARRLLLHALDAVVWSQVDEAMLLLHLSHTLSCCVTERVQGYGTGHTQCCGGYGPW